MLLACADVTVDEKPSVQQEEHANEVSKSASSEDEPVAPQTETPATNSYSAPAPAPVYSAPATAVSGYQPPSSTPAPAVSQSTGYQPPSYSAAPSMAAVSGNHNAHSGSYQPSMQQSGSRPPAPADGDESIQARKIFLGGLPGPTTEEELMGVFSNFGPVQETIVIRRNGRPRGFGFVIFQTKAGADAVLAAHNSGGVVIGGRTIDCKSTFARGSDAEKKHGATQPAPGAAPHQRYVLQLLFVSPCFLCVPLGSARHGCSHYHVRHNSLTIKQVLLAYTLSVSTRACCQISCSLHGLPPLHKPSVQNTPLARVKA